MNDHEQRIAALEKLTTEQQERIVKLEGGGKAMNAKMVEFMDHYARDFNNRVAEAMRGLKL